MYYHHYENVLLHALQIITIFLSIPITFDILINVSYLSNDFPDKPTFTITELKESWYIMCSQQAFSNYFYLFYILQHWDVWITLLELQHLPHICRYICFLILLLMALSVPLLSSPYQEYFHEGILRVGSLTLVWQLPSFFT